ncbi:MAG: hypothetical protein HY262_00750 [Chloroflexi bacterium]|nr:hypothetical protein [Chloroflexota bacterium]
MRDSRRARVIDDEGAQEPSQVGASDGGRRLAEFAASLRNRAGQRA